MPEPIDSFTVDLFGPSLPSQLDPASRVGNKLSASGSSNTRNERDGEQGRSPQPLPQSVTTDVSPYVTLIAQNLYLSIFTYVVSHPGRSHFPLRRSQLLRNQ